jgi:hypothetical protein
MRRRPDALTLSDEFAAKILITVNPEHVSLKALHNIEYVVALGAETDRRVASFCAMIGEPAPPPFAQPLERGQALFWSRGGRQTRLISLFPPSQQRQRHSRKYAEGELGEDKSFYFRRAACALNLRAQKLSMFLQIAEGIDDATWLYHLRAGDYSRWFRHDIKDKELADEIAAVESDRVLSTADSRRSVKEAVDRRYTSSAWLRAGACVGVGLLAEDVVRPVLCHMRHDTCWRSKFKGLTLQDNSIYNGWRMEDVWLDR